MTNQLFGLITMTMSNPTTGRTGSHVLGAIFDVDAQGVATDFTPIDFDGAKVRKWEQPQYGHLKGKTDRFVGAETALFFPISKQTAAQLKDSMRTLAEKVKDGKNPFYHAGFPMERNPRFEPLDQPVPTFVEALSRHTGHATSCEPAAAMAARRPINCRQFVIDMLEQIGHVPIDALAVDDLRLPRGMDEQRMADVIIGLAGQRSIPWNKKQPGRMIPMGEGRYAFAFDDTTGWITAALNRLPKHRTADGREMSVAQFLTQESAPFYDPKLNDVNLAHDGTAQGCAR